jgi:CubicO group peptidase (beta-lactamase class C family)
MGGQDGPVLPRTIFLGTSNGPAGATPMARARDLVSFGLMHLNEGLTREGVRVLSRASVLAMREPQNALPAKQIAHHFGLGFMLFDWGGHALFGHDGLSIFQRSYLRILPDKRMVFALLTNGGDGGGLFRELASNFFGSAGVTMSPILTSNPDIQVDAERYVGVYERRSTRVTVAAANSKLTMTTVWHDDWARELYGTMGPFPLEPIDADTFLCLVPSMVEPQLVNFMSPGADGRFQSLHTGLRINHRR